MAKITAKDIAAKKELAAKEIKVLFLILEELRF